MPRRPTLLRTRWTRIRSTRRFWTARTLWLRWQRRSSFRTRCRAVEGGKKRLRGDSTKCTGEAQQEEELASPKGFEPMRSEEHTSELQSLRHLVCRLLLEKKK